MIKFWVNRIKQGKATVDDVPMQWRDAVAEELAKEEQFDSQLD